MRKAHSGSVPPLGELLKAARGSRSQDAVSVDLSVSQPRYQRWEAMLVDVDADRGLHARLQTFLGLDDQTYAQSALEHSIRVKERRQ